MCNKEYLKLTLFTFYSFYSSDIIFQEKSINPLSK